MSKFKAYLRLFVSIAFILGTVFVLYKVMVRDDFKIAKIEVRSQSKKNNPNWLNTDVKPKLQPFMGEFIWSVNLEKILDSILLDRRVKDVKVRRRFPDELLVEVLPHKSLAMILAGSGKEFYPLSREGGILPAVSALNAEDAPILRGRRFLKDLDLRTKAVKALLALPEVGNLSHQNLSEITFIQGKGLVLYLSDGIEVLLGLEDVEKRIQRSKRVVDYLRSKKLTRRVVDARFRKKVVVRLSSEP